MHHLSLNDLILRLAGQQGIALNEEQTRLLSLHIQIMLEWNSRLNLTRITGTEDVIVKHLLDSIAPSKFLPSSGHALDVGTGAGFPGIPLKIICHGLQMFLLDSSRKKVSFLIAAAASMQLKGVVALHDRWQDFIKAEEHLNKFDLITIRALRPEPEQISRLAAMALAPGGVLARWEAVDEERPEECGVSGTDKEHHQGVEFQGTFEYSLPGIRRPRAVRLWKKLKSSPAAPPPLHAS